MSRHHWRRRLGSCLGALLLMCGTPAAHSAIAMPQASFEVLARFAPEGCRSPSSALTQGLDGHFYGVMAEGGSLQGGCLYRVSQSGVLTVLHEFDASQTAQGSHPLGALRLNADGTLMGTTLLGGGTGLGGTLYQVNSQGEITYLRSFGQDPLGFKGPTGAPMRASDGRLYGTLAYDSRGEPGGLVYSVDERGGDYRVLHQFKIRRPGDLAGPWGPLLQGQDGALYGTLVFGPMVPDGGVAVDGAVYRLSLDGKYRVMHTMYVVGDGTFPQGALVQAADGWLYGTNALYGGDGFIDTRGTVFRVAPGQAKNGQARFKVLYTGSEFGAGPSWLGAPLTPQPDGSFWSVSVMGGSFRYGTVYRVTRRGDMQVMHSFTGSGGTYPDRALTPGADGWLYGITNGSTGPGGVPAGAVIFRIRPQ